MKKYRLIIVLFLSLLIMPLTVNAGGLAYDVIKKEAESNGLAKKYTGEHNDSANVNPAKDIYHWYASNDFEGVQVTEKNNVIFGGYCWQMIRTTDIGGVKMIYNGVPNNGKCNNTGTAQQIGVSRYNPGDYGAGYVGYMYSRGALYSVSRGDVTEGSLWGNRVKNSNSTYTLIDTQDHYDDYHHYTCNNTTGTCSSVRYYFLTTDPTKEYTHYYWIANGWDMNGYLDVSLTSVYVNDDDSTIKSYVESWYGNNMTNYTSKLEDAVYCNDRNYAALNGYNANGGSNRDSLILFGGAEDGFRKDSLYCANLRDRQCVNSSRAGIDYPTSLITAPELRLLGNSKIYSTGESYWTITPSRFYTSAFVVNVNADGTLGEASPRTEYGVRPVITLKAGSVYLSGNGSKNNPYVIGEPTRNNIYLDNDDTKGTISIGKTSNVLEISTINFSITPQEGYEIEEVSIKDQSGNPIDFTNDGNQYSFEMPGANVIIKPTYKKVKNSVNVEIVNETENLTIAIDDLSQVEFGEEVLFTVNPIRGYKVNSIRIVDSNNNAITCNQTDDENVYSFVMGATSVTIIPVYEKVSNSVSVFENIFTKQIIIEVNDAKAVVYQDTVKITVIPADGYEVDYLEIMDEEGNRIEYHRTEKENQYEFVMPTTKVTIRPFYKVSTNPNRVPRNPRTKDGIRTIVIIVLLSLIATIYLYKKKKELI